MSPERSVIILLCLVNAVSSISVYQEQLNSLSQNVTIQLGLFRDWHYATISSFLRRSLEDIGSHTVQGRIRTAESLEYINSFGESFCVEQALGEQMLYAQTLGKDLSGCAERAYDSVSEDNWEDFHQLIASVQLTAVLALNQGMVAFEVESTEEYREQYLREELDFFGEIWTLYSELLDRRLIEAAEQFEESSVDVEKCLRQALFFFDYAVEYVKGNLDQCLSNLNK